MSVFLSFIDFVEGQDRFGDLIARQAEKFDRMERERYPFNHIAILIGDRDYGYYRGDCLTTGLEYTHNWTLPVGVSFCLDSGLSLPEKEVFYRAWHPTAKGDRRKGPNGKWEGPGYHTDWRQTKRQLKGETVTPINFEDGAMNCITFALLCCGRLDLPHRFPELFRALQKEGHVQINNRKTNKDTPDEQLSD
jgi:hypothetical protein